MMTHWRGRALETLTREELIEVIQWQARQLAERTSPEAIRAAALGRVAMIKRGET